MDFELKCIDFEKNGTKNTFQKNVLARLILYKLQNNLFTKQIPSHVLLQTGTNQWQQHYKENALVELFFGIITKIVIGPSYFVIVSARMVEVTFDFLSFFF